MWLSGEQQAVTTDYRYRMVTRAKPVTWGGVRWTAVDDAKLLVGVYEHGMGNWEIIRGNSSLGLSNKVSVRLKPTSLLRCVLAISLPSDHAAREVTEAPGFPSADTSGVPPEAAC